MQRRVFINSNGIPLGWPERILAGIVAVLVVLLGLAFGAVILGLGAVLGLGLAARVWWLSRQTRREGGQRRGGRVIEGEYRVLERNGPDRGSHG